MAAGTHYIALGQTTQKTVVQTIAPLLHVTKPLPSNACFSGYMVLALGE
jgi:hypothetical protein